MVDASAFTVSRIVNDEEEREVLATPTTLAMETGPLEPAIAIPLGDGVTAVIPPAPPCCKYRAEEYNTPGREKVVLYCTLPEGHEGRHALEDLDDLPF
jgi:hypothetical protein